jgi:hypothetical protein
MKTLLLFIATLMGVASTEAAYRDFRVVNIVRVEGIAADLTGDPAIDALPPSSHFTVSFTCDPGSTYLLEASESLGNNEKWFPVSSTITADQKFNPLTKNVGGEDIVTVQVSMPFLTWSTNPGKGFLRVSEISKEPLPAESDYAPITSMVNHGNYITVTFLSEPYSEYLIKGAAVPAAPSSDRWCPVDTYWNGQVIPTTIVYSNGEETTVDIANPMLPWILKNRGFLLIHKKPSPSPTPRGPTGPIAAMATIQNFWSLVCTRDGGDDPPMRFKDLGLAGLSGQIAVVLGSTGPDVAEYGKYMIVKSVGLGQLSGPLVPDTSIRLPLVRDPAKPEEDEAKQFVRLSFYEYTDSKTVPEVKFEPNPDKHHHNRNNFHFQLMIQSGSVIGVAAYEPEEALSDTIKLEPLGVGFQIKVPKNGGQCIADQNWQFSAMDVPTLQAFVAAMEKGKKK